MYFSQYLVFYLFQDLAVSVKNDQHKITFCLEYNMLSFERLFPVAQQPVKEMLL